MIKNIYIVIVAISILFLSGCSSVITPPPNANVDTTIGDGVYLYTNNSVMYINETTLNSTIDDRVNITVYENATPQGVDTSVQFNDNGVFSGDSDFIYDETTNLLSVNGEISADSLNIVGDSSSEVPIIKLQSVSTNYAEGGQIQFLEHESEWGVNAYGFRWMIDGATNRLKLQSAVTSTIYDNIMNIERNSGNIGIGMVATKKLDVEGDLRINDELSSQSSLYLKGTGHNIYQPTLGSNYFNTAPLNNVLYVYDYTHSSSYTSIFGDRITLQYDGINKVNIDNDGNSYFNGGNVGIGTATPDVKLEIVGPGSSTDVLKLVKGSGTSGISFVFSEAGTYPSYIRTYENSAGTGHMTFGVNSDSGSTKEVMKLMGSGKVGIGATPSNMLSVYNTDDTILASFSNGQGDLGDETLLRIGGVSTHYGVYIGSSNEAGTPSAWDSAFIVKTNDYTGTDHVERFRVTSNGDVGIGTSLPEEKLEVIGNIKATSFIGSGAGLTNINIENAFKERISVISANNLITDGKFNLNTESDRIWNVNSNHNISSSIQWMHDNKNLTLDTYNDSMFTSSNRRVVISSTDINFSPIGYTLDNKFVKFLTGNLTNYVYAIDSYNESSNSITLKVNHFYNNNIPHYNNSIPVSGDKFQIVTMAGASSSCLAVFENSMSRNAVTHSDFIPFNPTKPLSFQMEMYGRNMHINQLASRHYIQYQVYDEDFNPIKRYDSGSSVTDNTDGWQTFKHTMPAMNDVDRWVFPVSTASVTAKMYLQIVIKSYDEGNPDGSSSSAWFITGFSANAGDVAFANTPHSLTEEGEQNIVGSVNIYNETSSQSDLFVEGNIEIGDLNTGSNAGSTLCIDTNNKICACGSCA